MAGTKGHSGRRCYSYDEDRAIADILELSSANIKAYLKHPDVSLDKKALISSTFLSRRVSNKQETKHSLDITDIDKQILAKYNKPLVLECNDVKLIDSV